MTLTKPNDKTVDLEAAIVFPTEHVRRIIDAAREDKTILEFPVYDGSENRREGLQHAHRHRPRDRAERARPTDAAAGKRSPRRHEALAGHGELFRQGAKAGEQAPVYSIKFELYENGISRALVLDYNDFAISGELTTLEIRDSKPCK